MTQKVRGLDMDHWWVHHSGNNAEAHHHQWKTGRNVQLSRPVDNLRLLLERVAMTVNKSREKSEDR
jgi:hypothetical protein